MERKVYFRDRQELQSADLGNIQEFSDQTFQHVITDALTGERQIVGLTVTAKSATEVEVSIGRLWDGTTGKIYRNDEAVTISIFSYLPVSDKKYLAVSIYGQEATTDIQPRDFLIDLQTGQTEPQAVAMETARSVVTQITAGLESSDPQKPAAPTGYTVIAYVKLNSSGIDSIELADNARLRSLFNVNSRLTVVENWKDLVDPRVATLASDVANLSKRIAGLAYIGTLKDVAADVARLKELENMPDTYASYGADHFLDEAESEVDNVAYYARVDEGIRFPWAGQTKQVLDLYNPFETSVQKFTGFILPDYNETVRLATSGYAGNLSISQYQYQTHTVKQGIMSRTRFRYGPTRRVCTNSRWWTTGNYDPITKIFTRDGETFVVEANGGTPNHYWLRVTQFWTDRTDEPYWYVDVTTTSISGSQIAQTFLNSQNGWLTKLGLYFESLDNNGIVYVHLCETANGLPVLSKCIGTAQVAAADLNAYPAETVFEFTQPVFLAAGKRYALVVTTAGDHHVVIVSGTEYTQGTLFYSMDGAYYQGDYTKDLMMRFYYAAFKNPRTVVELTPLSLSGGIADLDLIAESIVPDATELTFEYQKSGVWYPINDATADQLLGLPAMVSMRAVFIGSQDLMPGLNLAGSELKGNRPALTFTHYSEMQTLGAASEAIEVQALLEGWDNALHTCTIKILPDGGTLTDPVSTADTVIDAESIRRKASFTFSPGITDFQIVISGTSSTALDIFHVAERIHIAQ